MAQNPDLYHRHFEMTSKGIRVTETSDDPDMVAVILPDKISQLKSFKFSEGLTP